MIGKLMAQTRGFATKMMAGSTSNSKDSAGRRLGIKKWGQSEVLENEIIARQRGFQWHPGQNVHYGKDHTLHSSVEGILGWSKDPFARKRRSHIHVIPQEIPNRKFPAPPPFVYHPQLYPELAEHNPQPTNFEIPKSKGPKRVKNPQPLRAKSVAPENVQRIEVKNMTPELFRFHGKFAYESYDADKIDQL